MSTKIIEKEQKTILPVYGLMALSLLLSLIPVLAMAVAALALFTATLIAAYILRRRTGPETLTAHHMTYIIRTLWIASLLALITVGIASAFVLPLYDPGPMQACINQAANALMASADTAPDMAAINAMLQPCIGALIDAIRGVFLIGTLIAAAPLFLYAFMRLHRGYKAARAGAFIADMKKWF